MSTDTIPLLPFGYSRERVGLSVTYGEKIVRTGIRGNGSVVPIITRITSTYLLSFGAD